MTESEIKQIIGSAVATASRKSDKMIEDCFSDSSKSIPYEELAAKCYAASNAFTALFAEQCILGILHLLHEDSE